MGAHIHIHAYIQEVWRSILESPNIEHTDGSTTTYFFINFFANDFLVRYDDIVKLNFDEFKLIFTFSRKFQNRILHIPKETVQFLKPHMQYIYHKRANLKEVGGIGKLFLPLQLHVTIP